MSDAMFSAMASFGLVAPSVAVASGLVIVVRRVVAKTQATSPLSEPAVAFMMMVAAGTLAFAATVDNPGDIVSGLTTSCVLGQLAPGLYVPFALPVAAAYAASKTASRWRMRAAIVVGAVGWWGSCLVGATLGYAH